MEAADTIASMPPLAVRGTKELIQMGRGRPKKGQETGPTEPRSIRFPPSVWKEVEKRARGEGLTVHAALRAAVLEWVKRR